MLRRAATLTETFVLEFYAIHLQHRIAALETISISDIITRAPGHAHCQANVPNADMLSSMRTVQQQAKYAQMEIAKHLPAREILYGRGIV